MSSSSAQNFWTCSNCKARVPNGCTHHCPTSWVPGQAKVTAPTLRFLTDVRAVVRDHWSGLPEHRPDEKVWARLDAVLFDGEGQERPEPDYSAMPERAEDASGLQVVPLEALRLGPGEVLILRLTGSWTPTRIDEISATLKPLGLDGRVLIVANEIELAVVEAEPHGF